MSPPRRTLLWELRVSTSLPLPPLAVGGVIATALIGSVLVAHWTFGVPVLSAGESVLLPFRPSAKAAFLLAILVGYGIGAFGHAVQHVIRDLPRFGFSGSGPLWSLETSESELIRSRWAGAGGLGFGLLMDAAVLWNAPETRSFEFTGSLLLAPALLWIVARSAYFSIRRTRELAALAGTAINLLDLRPMRIFGQIALRISLLWIVAISLAIPFFFDLRVLVPLLPVMAAGVGIAALSLVMPMRGARRAIRAAKQAELDAVQARLGRLRDAVVRDDATASGRLADLLAYRAYVEGLREWPLDASSLARLALYLLIPLGSWLGGALVERLLSVLLD